MESNDILKYFLFICILTFPLLAEGQSNYKKGYVITLNDDTIHGKVNDRGDYRNTQACWFKQGKNSKVIKYLPSDIKAYRIIGDNYYMSRQIYKKGIAASTFVEVLIDGKVNLYYYIKGKKTSFFIERENSDQLIGLTNEKLSEFYRPLPDNPVSYSKDYYLTNTAYLDTLSSVFRDDQKIQKTLHTTSYYRKSLIRVTKNYINDVCKGEDCLTYEKDITKKNPRVGVFTGMQVSQVSFYADKNQTEKITTNAIISAPIGAFVNVPLPIINDRFSVQLELVHHNIHYSQEITSPSIKSIELNTTPISVPLSLKYEITREKLSPSVSFGTEAKFVRSGEWKRELGDGGGWFGEIGIDYKIYKKLSVFANLRMESKKHYLEVNSDNTIRYLNYDIRKVKPVIGLVKAKTDFATLYIGFRF